MKIIFYPEGIDDDCGQALMDSPRRVTVQLRQYNAVGRYLPGSEVDRGNETLWVKGYDVAEVYEIIKAALMQSRHLDVSFEVTK